MNYWTTRDGTKIQVKNMELSHVENTLRMLIKKYTWFCIQHGADYASSINLDKMTEISNILLPTQCIHGLLISQMNILDLWMIKNIPDIPNTYICQTNLNIIQNMMTKLLKSVSSI